MYKIDKSYKKYNNDYKSKDYAYNSYNPNNVTVEKSNSGKPEVKKVILLVFYILIIEERRK
jgi:hypothetical protein